MASIAVIGSGAVGGYYGGLLARAGHDVRFLMRSDLEAVRANGLSICSPRGDFHLPSVRCEANPEDIGVCDWVICALKTTALGDAEALCSPCIGPQTRVLALMNGLNVEEDFARWVDPARVFGGMAFVCINRGAPGVVHHLEYGRVSIGNLRDDAAENELLRNLLEPAGIETVVSPNLRFARWEKLCWNVPFNGLSVAAGGIGTETIMQDPELARTAERAMREVVAVGNADLEALGREVRLDADDIVERLFAQTATMGDYRTSMVIDYVLGRPLEVERIHGEVARRARELGVNAATIETLYALVRAADERNRDSSRVIQREDLESPAALRPVAKSWV